METRSARIGLGAWSVLVIAFLWVPLVIIAIYAFNSSNIQSWPIPGWTLHWFRVTWHNQEARSSFELSLAMSSSDVVLTRSPVMNVDALSTDQGPDRLGIESPVGGDHQAPTAEE